MAFKMKGFNPGKGTGMGSAFTKPEKIKKEHRPDVKSNRLKNVVTHDMSGDPIYSKEEQASGAGASKEFYGTESRGSKKKLKIKKGPRKPKTVTTDKEFNVKGAKRDRHGDVKSRKGLDVSIVEGEKKRRKKKAKTNIFTGKKTIKIDDLKKQQSRVKSEEKRHKKETGEDVYLGEGTARKDADFTFTGADKKDQKLQGRKRKATFNPKTGEIAEKVKRKSGIGYRKTGRTVTDEAYVKAAKEKQEGPSKKEQKKTKKAKEKKTKQENKDFQRKIMEKQIASGERKPQPKFL